VQHLQRAIHAAGNDASYDVQFSLFYAMAELAEHQNPRTCASLLAAADTARRRSYLLRAEYDRLAAVLATRVQARLRPGQWEDALRKGRALSLGTAARLLESPPGKAGNAETALTQREGEVIRAVAAGLTNAQIASRMVISTTTVNAHIRNIFAKFNVHTRTAAVEAYRASRE
jgi:DNA-binding NarL/FixJ family response regulator